MMDHLRRLLQYDAWANRETLESLRKAAPPPKSLRWMAHIVGAEFIWLARLRGETSPLAVWPELDVGACGARLEELSRRWPEYLDDTSKSITGIVSYTNSKGEVWTSTVEEILTHVPFHSAYHRGQIATDLRAAGMVPAYTDYIHAVRQGCIR
ncbi:MAG: DinB family protein [Gemmatimonadales bacterium]|nr:DinB family protein [Gemmatimonadales bacterium]